MFRCAMVMLGMLAVAPSLAAPLRVMGFGGSSNWPVFVAQEMGLFEREGLDVEILATPDSSAQLASLMQGRVDIALTAIDNVIAYREGQVEPMPEGDRDIVAFLGVNHGGRSTLVGGRGVKAIRDLKGTRLGVDALSTGYAFVLEEMLRRGGLARGDYQLVSVGAGRKRWEALREGKVAAALLNAPLDATAEAAGFPRLGATSDVVTRYQGSVGAVRRAWAREHEAQLMGFIRAYVAAMDWLYDPLHARQAQAILAKHQPGLKPAELLRSYAELLHPQRGSLSRRAAIDPEGVRTVVELRSRYAVPARELGAPEHYYDNGYYERAVGVGPRGR